MVVAQEVLGHRLGSQLDRIWAVQRGMVKSQPSISAARLNSPAESRSTSRAAYTDVAAKKTVKRDAMLAIAATGPRMDKFSRSVCNRTYFAAQSKAERKEGRLGASGATVKIPLARAGLCRTVVFTHDAVSPGAWGFNIQVFRRCTADSATLLLQRSPTPQLPVAAPGWPVGLLLVWSVSRASCHALVPTRRLKSEGMALASSL
jgi:hypothetical protein